MDAHLILFFILLFHAACGLWQGARLLLVLHRHSESLVYEQASNASVLRHVYVCMTQAPEGQEPSLATTFIP
jgi:hypothetical protein